MTPRIDDRHTRRSDVGRVPGDQRQTVMECRGGTTQAQIAVEPALECGALRIVVAEQIDALDRRLSRDRSDACASCHNPKRAFSSAQPIAVGAGGTRRH